MQKRNVSPKILVCQGASFTTAGRSPICCHSTCYNQILLMLIELKGPLMKRQIKHFSILNSDLITHI